MIINFDRLGQGGGSGSGSTVSWRQDLSAGTQIAQITINGTPQSVFAPSGSTYELPVATDEVLGGVKIGSGITVDSAGTISVEGGETPTVDKLMPVSGFPEDVPAGTLVSKNEIVAPGHWTGSTDEEHPYDHNYFVNSAWTAGGSYTIGTFYSADYTEEGELITMKVRQQEPTDPSSWIVEWFAESQGDEPVESCDFFSGEVKAFSTPDAEYRYQFSPMMNEEGEEPILILLARKLDGEDQEVENDMTFIDPQGINVPYTYQYDGSKWNPVNNILLPVSRFSKAAPAGSIAVVPSIVQIFEWLPSMEDLSQAVPYSGVAVGDINMLTGNDGDGEATINHSIAHFSDGSLITLRKNDIDNYCTFKYWAQVSDISEDSYIWELSEGNTEEWDIDTYHYVASFSKDEEGREMLTITIYDDYQGENEAIVAPQDAQMWVEQFETYGDGKIFQVDADGKWVDIIQNLYGEIADVSNNLSQNYVQRSNFATINGSGITNGGNFQLATDARVEDVERVAAIALNNVNTLDGVAVKSTSIRNIVQMTQAQYDALSGNTDSSTLYLIIQ